MAALFAFGMPGPMELFIILAILLLLFGGAKIPSIAKNLGRAKKEFEVGIQGLDQIDQEDSDQQAV